MSHALEPRFQLARTLGEQGCVVDRMVSACSQGGRRGLEHAREGKGMDDEQWDAAGLQDVPSGG